MNMGLLFWCKILSLVLLCRPYAVACDHPGSALHRSHSKSNSAEIDVECYTRRGKKYTKKVKKPPDNVSRSSDDGPPEPFLRLFVLDISNMNDTEFTKYKYKNDHHIFIAKGPFLVMAIRRGFNFLWHPTKNRYPNVVVIYPKEKQTRKLRLFYPGQRTGFTDPEDEPKPEKPQQLRGFVEQKKQKKKYSVETIGVEKSQTTLKTKKVKHHVPEGLVESDPEPATDIEVELTDEPKPEEIPQVQPQQVPPPIAIVQPQQVPHPIAIAPPLEPLPPPPIPQFQVPIVPVPSLQVVQPQVLLFPPQPVQNILVHLNIKDKRNTDILRYIWDENDKADVFSLEYPYLFDMVLMGDELLWEPDGNYPYEVKVFHLADGQMRMRAFFPFNEPKIATPALVPPLPQQPILHPLQVPQPTPLLPLQLPVLPQPQEVPQLQQTTPQPPKPMSEDYKPVAQPPEQAAKPGPQAVETQEKMTNKKTGNLVKLDINDKWSDDYVDYVWDDTIKADVFVARPPYLLGTIVDGSEILWKKKNEDCPYAISVTRGQDGQLNLRVYFSDPQPLIPQTQGKQPFNLVKLDINDKWSDEYVYYVWDDMMKADVFVARHPYLLGTIVDGSEILWKKRDGEYPYAVAIINPGSDNTLVRTYFSGPEDQPRLQQVPETPKTDPKDQINNNVQALN